ncbi:DUF3592 domain-containing protein [Paraburkholderia sp. SIMBA_049]
MPVTEEVLWERIKIVLLAIVWVGSVIGLINSIESTRAFLDAAVAAPGRVVALNAGGSHPEIEYINKKGERVSYPQGGWIGGYKMGDRVTVLYLEHSSNPLATIDRVGAIWSSTVFLAFIVVGFPLMGFVGFVYQKLYKNEGRSKWKITD